VFKSVYIHIPFCTSICPYCDFYSLDKSEKYIEPYIAALKKEIDHYADLLSKQNIETIFLGGGTPSLFTPQQIQSVIDYLATKTNLSQSAEVTIECNPKTLSREQIFELKKTSVNRLSVGVQSFNPIELGKLGRAHTVDETTQILNWIKEAGFTNYSIDLMFGIPLQTLDSWKKTLEETLKFDPPHISAYSLILEKETPYYELAQNKRLAVPEEDATADMFEWLTQFLPSKGLRQYEISNFAKPGFECRHNLAYWHNEEFLGLGTGAHGQLGEKRYAVPKDLTAYLAGTFQYESHGQNEALDELSTRLRLLDEPFSILDWQKKYQLVLRDKFFKKIDELVRKDLIVFNNQQIILTKKGMLFLNQVILDTYTLV
jgi:putative oxygen-independent coproporphyrinogen III oxidase